MLLLIIVIFSGLSSQAQTWEDKVKNDPAYEKYKEEALKFYCSEDYIKEMYLGSYFIEKMGKSIQNYDFKNFEKWITENLDKTTFVNKEEALQIFNERSALKSKNQPESNRLSKEFDNLGEKYGYDEFMEFENKEVHNVAFEKYYSFKQKQKTFN
ncbi:hypothetical protein [Paenimyroides aestuarii]|uniref:Uncharacterized protein n=1 Tax=Paenimyroides aestuarii TaxID=2968490 RepID=A0ABY5NVY4_9FLAO|nr:hypothetical protein [Paenimyroides aestuarii]UUV22756.1 hypothetical protein NPX36_06870 [Paenimyroides aestuarii]